MGIALGDTKEFAQRIPVETQEIYRVSVGLGVVKLFPDGLVVFEAADGRLELPDVNAKLWGKEDSRRPIRSTNVWRSVCRG